MLDKIVSGANEKGKSWLYFIIYAVIILIIVVVIIKVYKAAKAGVNSVGNLAADATKSTQTGIPLARLQEIRNRAETLWTKDVKGFGNFWRPTNYNEENFIAAINSMQSIQEVQLLAQYYQEVAEESLATSLDASFDNGDIAKLKTGYYSTIKSI
ncbi:MAG: hypothetical protein NTZ59_02395 [Bacteroidetes bacterium]|nr:hypothetical protein [Bacteroidota bacterium]